MKDNTKTIHVVGAGLAGSECAYQLAEMGHEVILFEMRDQVTTPAHKTQKFAELVCSNSLGSQTDYSAPGQLKWEAKRVHCLTLEAAEASQVPAGMALAVDREKFSDYITRKIQSHSRIQIKREVISSLDSVPRPAVIATGPLTHESMAHSLQQHFGRQFLFFYDAIAPIIDTSSIDMNICWKGDRWGKGNQDYINCPLSKDQYFHFIHAVSSAEKIIPKEFERTPYFESCLPIEALVERGPLTLKFGPMSPKGLRDPRNGKSGFAIAQLRQDNQEATAYNMVGFQTKMTYPEQKRVFRMIPGLADAEFLKLGSIHRNLYIDSPQMLNEDLSSRHDPWLFFAGQITGVEGYFESACIGLLVAHFIHQKILEMPFSPPPRSTMLGSLLFAITKELKSNFQPTNVNFSLFPRLDTELCSEKGPPTGHALLTEMNPRMTTSERRQKQLERARDSFLFF